MPYVNIKLTPENLTAEMKQMIIADVTRILVKRLNKNPDTTVVVIDVVEADNWGISGKAVSTLRKMNELS